MEINLSFVNSSSEAYKEKLQTFMDNILDQGITENRPPRIAFAGMNRATTVKISKLRRAYYQHRQ